MYVSLLNSWQFSPFRFNLVLMGELRKPEIEFFHKFPSSVRWGLVLPVNQNLGCYLITPFNHSAVENNLRLKSWRLGKLGWRRFNHFVANMLLQLWHMEHRLYCYGGQVQTICHKANSLQIQVLTLVFWCQFLRNFVCYSFFIDMVAIWYKTRSSASYVLSLLFLFSTWTIICWADCTLVLTFLL